MILWHLKKLLTYLQKDMWATLSYTKVNKTRDLGHRATCWSINVKR